MAMSIKLLKPWESHHGCEQYLLWEIGDQDLTFGQLQGQLFVTICLSDSYTI
jgi:hypothetical protein